MSRDDVPLRAPALAMAEAALDAIISIDSDGQITHFNRAAENTFGHRREEVIGRDLAEVIIPPALRGRHRGGLARYLHTGKATILGQRLELTGMRANGSEFPVELTVTRIDESETPAFTGYVRDISDRRRAEEVQAQLAAIVEFSQDAIIGVTLDGVITSWNRGAEKLYLFSADEAIGSSLTMVVPPERSQEIIEIVACMRRGEHVQEYETERRRKDGLLVDVSLSISPVKDVRGTAISYSVIARDIGGRRQTESELRETGERFRSLFDQAAVGISLCDLDGHWLLVNERLCELYGRSQAELLDLRFQDISHPDDLESDLMHLSRMIAGEIDSYSVEKRFIQPDGSATWVQVTVSLVHDPLGSPKFTTAVVQDISERKAYETQLRHQALHDELTDLPNRTLLTDRIWQALMASRRGKEPGALLFLDLDRFKEVNDSLGHGAGDLLLRTVSDRFQTVVRESDTVARFGGDVFAIVLSGVDEAGAVGTAIRLLASLEEPIVIGDRSLYAEVSIGIVLFPEHGDEPDILLRRADVAMFTAKRARAGYACYQDDADVHSSDRLSLIGDLRHAIESDELLLHYQPKVNMKTGGATGVEALVRWNHPARGLIPPLEFVPLAEETGYIRQLTVWVLTEAARQAHSWRAAGFDASVAVNLSTWNLHDPDLVDRVARVLQEGHFDPSMLQLEITESALMIDPIRARASLTALHQMGVRISIDDFGTGYSSLAYLRDLPVDEIKIDRSFVREMIEGQEQSLVLVRSIIELAHNLGLEAVAEGVETRFQLEALGEMGCDYAQGFGLARPLVADQYPHWLVEWDKRRRPSRRWIA